MIYRLVLANYVAIIYCFPQSNRLGWRLVFLLSVPLLIGNLVGHSVYHFIIFLNNISIRLSLPPHIMGMFHEQPDTLRLTSCGAHYRSALQALPTLWAWEVWWIQSIWYVKRIKMYVFDIRLIAQTLLVSIESNISLDCRVYHSCVSTSQEQEPYCDWWRSKVIWGQHWIKSKSIVSTIYVIQVQHTWHVLTLVCQTLLGFMC